MIQSEAQLEQQFLEKLKELKYTYRSDSQAIAHPTMSFRILLPCYKFLSISANYQQFKSS